MKRFSEWIRENLIFRNANDSDYTSDKNKVVFFSPKDKKVYIEQGKTHGSASHAIKHYDEFNPQRYRKIADKVKAKIKELSKSGELDYLALFDKNTKSFLSTDIQVVIEKAPWRAYLNALDLINDKREQGRLPLSLVEKKMLPFLEELSAAYLDEINKVMKSAVNLDKLKSQEEILNAIKTNNVVSMSADDRNGHKTFYLDFKHNIIVIAEGDVVITCFEFDTPAHEYKGVLANFWRKKQFIPYDNNLIPSVINLIIGSDAN